MVNVSGSAMIIAMKKTAATATPRHLDDRLESSFYLPDLCEGRSVLFLLLVAELLAIVLSLADEGFVAFDWQSFALQSLFIQWAFLSSAACLCLLRTQLSQLPMAWAAAASYGMIVLLVVLLDLAAQWLLGVMLYSAADQLIDTDQLLNTAVMTAILAGIVLRYFYLTQQLRQREQAEWRARVQALQSRIRPHFLFNSMNIIASLIAVDPEAAERAVEDLSALFRASLGDMSSLVNLSDELELCQSYSRIEQYRLGERLVMDWQIDELPAQLTIPSLTLQPLLENAIYHGIQSLAAGGCVKVSASYSDQQLQLRVTNPYRPSHHRSGGNHMALQNIEQRLQAHYGRQAQLQIDKQPEQFSVLIRYPVSVDGADTRLFKPLGTQL